MLTTSPTCFIC